nr:6-phosphofructokinase [Ezakiella coagulans]
MKRIAILTSGGDAPGMNAAIRAVVRTAIYNNIEIYGVKMGYNGLINGDIFKMELSSVADIIHRGGTILGTARSDEFMTDEGKQKALESLRKNGIEGVVVIGGDGSMRGALSLHKLGVKTISIPATIDNDLGYTDYTIGFMTALETVADAISKLRDTSSAHGRANIVEVMGRNCGDIALYSGLAGGAETIFVPEELVNIDELVSKAISGIKRGKRHHIIVVAEGSTGTYRLRDVFEERTGIETRVTVLGHVQRGGTPTVFDRILGSRMGYEAVVLLKDGESGLSLGMKANEIFKSDIEDALSKEKIFNSKMLDIARILSI